MNIFQQTLHIFRKDLRATWWAIVAYLFSLGIICYTYPKTWQPYYLGINRLEMWWILPCLLAWVLVTLSIQQEPFVSDRSYWLTRPYNRTSLLLSKIVYAVITILLPLAVTQWYLLVRAELPVVSNLPLQVICLASIAVFLLIFATTAVVVRNFLFSLFTLIGIAAYIALFAMLIESRERNAPFDPSIADWWSFVVLVFAAGAAIAIQYFSRRKAFARLILICTLVLLTLPNFINMSAFSVPMHYPSNENVLRLVLDPSPTRRFFSGIEPPDGEVPVHVPILVQGPADDNEFAVRGLRIRISAKNGNAWDSGWKTHNLQLKPGTTTVTVEFMMPRKAWEQLQANPSVHIIADYAYEHRFLEPMQKFVLQKGPTPITGLGTCFVGSALGFYSEESLTCRKPFREQLTGYLSAEWTKGACGTPAAQHGGIGRTYTSGSTEEGWPLSLPGLFVNTYAPNEGLSEDKKGTSENLHLCSGNAISFRKITSRGQHTVTFTSDIPLRELSGYVAKEIDDKDED